MIEIYKIEVDMHLFAATVLFICLLWKFCISFKRREGERRQLKQVTWRRGPDTH